MPTTALARDRMSYRGCDGSHSYDESVPRVPLTSLLTVVLAAVLAVGGCGSEQPEAAPPAEPAASLPPEPPEPPARSASPSDGAEPAPTAKPRHGGRQKVDNLAPNARRAPAAEHLLSPDDLPAPAGTWSVAAAEGGDAGDPAVGACQKTGLGAIGALESAMRTYSADDATAVQVVARFADSRSAWRAHGVLEAWRENCAERLGHADIGTLEDVTVRVGTGASYRADFRKRSAGVGILRTGAYLTLVEITSTRYPSGWEPARVAVRRISRTF